MTRSITDAQLNNVDTATTRPVFILRWEHSGIEELLSASGLITYDGDQYDPGQIKVNSIRNSRSAVISVTPTPERIAEVQNGTWRQGDCEIYYIPAVPNDGGVYVAADAILYLDGKIMSSKWSGDSISVDIIHKNIDGNKTPRNTAEEVCSHIPSPGTIILWDSENIVLVGTR